MLELILVMETRASSNTDYMYIKSTLDYYYRPRTYGIQKIYSESKTELIKQDEKIHKAFALTTRKPVVIIFADYDRNEIINKEIIDYCFKNSYELVWMNSDIEEVYLGKKIKNKDKKRKAIDFQIHKDKLLPKLNNLEEKDPLKKEKTSNIICVFDKYLSRK